MRLKEQILEYKNEANNLKKLCEEKNQHENVKVRQQ